MKSFAPVFDESAKGRAPPFLRLARLSRRKRVRMPIGFQEIANALPRDPVITRKV